MPLITGRKCGESALLTPRIRLDANHCQPPVSSRRRMVALRGGRCGAGCSDRPPASRRVGNPAGPQFPPVLRRAVVADAGGTTILPGAAAGPGRRANSFRQGATGRPSPTRWQCHRQAPLEGLHEHQFQARGLRHLRPADFSCARGGRVLGVVELDDSSHQQRSRRERDEFFNAAFAAASIPVWRVPVQRRYPPESLWQQARAFLGAAN